MIVMTTARTPSLKASMRPLLIPCFPSIRILGLRAKLDAAIVAGGSGELAVTQEKRLLDAQESNRGKCAQSFDQVYRVLKASRSQSVLQVARHSPLLREK